jgi:hypothetical protein
MSEIPTFDVDITFTGLCLFVLDPANGPKKLHVLMPGTGCGSGHRHGGHHNHAHTCKLHVPPAHLPGGNGGTVWPRVIDGHTLSIPGAASGITQRRLPDSVAMLEPKVLRSLLGPIAANKDADIRSRLAARVDLAAGRVVETPRGGRFYYRGSVRHLTFSVVWRIHGLGGSELQLDLRPLDGSTDPDSIRLVPTTIENRQVIEMQVRFLPADEQGDINPCEQPVPEPRKVDHFAEFYRLTGANPGDIPMIRDPFGDPRPEPCVSVCWNEDGAEVNREAAFLSLATAPLIGGRPYTCVVGGGEAE